MLLAIGDDGAVATLKQDAKNGRPVRSGPVASARVQLAGQDLDATTPVRVLGVCFSQPA